MQVTFQCIDAGSLMGKACKSCNSILKAFTFGRSGLLGVAPENNKLKFLSCVSARNFVLK